MPYHSSNFPSVFVVGSPHALIAKTKNQSNTKAGGNTFEGPTFLPHLEVPIGESVLEA